MSTMLINATQAEELRVALTDENKLLYDYITERPGFEEKIGNIYLAEITSIEPSLDAIFVNFGSKRHGFLPLKEIAHEYFQTNDPEKLERPNIKELLREGQKLLVQVEKEERGNKGAALTTFISLAGSYLVLMPNNPRAGGISRRIEGEDRDELRELLNQLALPADMGLIVRTAGVGRSLEDLQWDLNVLLNYWEAIKKASQERSSPLLIHQESDVIIRGIRDYLRQDIKEIIIDNPNTFEKAKNYIQQVRPDYISRLKLYNEKIPLFVNFEIEHQIELAYQRTVRLKSGGSIVIDHTEALVSIDINSARATKGGDIEETAFNTNLEAAEEIARQLRLRDIGGLIVIDFIDMTPIRHQREVENHLRHALRLDRARVQVGRISSRFGLLEMSRQRLRPSLQEVTQEVCPRCNGQGSTRSIESLASSIIRMMEEDSIKENTAQIQLQLPNEAATYFFNEMRGLITGIEQRQGISIVVVANSNIQYPNYILKRIRKTDVIEQGIKLQTSYKLIEPPEIEISLKKAASGKPYDLPVVKNLLPNMPPAPSMKKPMQGLVKRLWTSMFGTATAKSKESTEIVAEEQSPRKHRTQRGYSKQRRRNNAPYRPSEKGRKAEGKPFPPQKQTAQQEQVTRSTVPNVKSSSPPKEKPEPSHQRREPAKYTQDDNRSKRPEKRLKEYSQPKTTSTPTNLPKPETSEPKKIYKQIETQESEKREELAPIIIRREKLTYETNDESEK